MASLFRRNVPVVVRREIDAYRVPTTEATIDLLTGNREQGRERKPLAHREPADRS